MEAVARASIAASSHARVPCAGCQRHAARCLRGRRSVACAAAADADVVRLFDAAKLTRHGGRLGPAPRRGSPSSTGNSLRRGSLTGIVGIPSSVICASEAEKAGIKVRSHEEGAKGHTAAVIGREKSRVEILFIQEKGIVKSADKVAFIIDNDKYVSGIEGSIPVLVKSGNWIDTAEEIDDLFLGDAEVWRRPSIGTAGPSGGDFPLVTKEGHHILDVIFTTPIQDLGKVAEGLEKIALVDYG
ncbi:hypothetical protein ZWY2020_030516 [Hordeum vulgare]|nr:hypothetical protein ZWY2020_030516 [Hordeum vulgare]